MLHAVAACRGVAALGSDGVSDVLTLRIDGSRLSRHEVAIHKMGVHLLDNPDLEELGRRCEAEGRAAFLLAIGPLVVRPDTAWAVNPIALFR